jgi:hypothetical protein
MVRFLGLISIGLQPTSDFQTICEADLQSAPNISALIDLFARPHRRWFALAASVLISLGVASGFWLAAPRSTLAAEVVAHMAGEPDVWNTHAPIPNRQLAGVLAKANISLDPGALWMRSQVRSTIVWGSGEVDRR